MAVAADMWWEMRTTGAATNGGGYKQSAGTTDYSQQDAAQLALTDVVVTQAAPTTLTSATAGFTAAMVGNTVYLSGGTGGTVTTGWYEITARADASNVTIDRTCSPTAATVTAVTCNVGGALFIVNGTNLSTLLATFAAGNKLYIKVGTYTITTANITAGTVGTTANPVNVIGYNATRGDNPTATRPIFSMGAYTWTWAVYWRISYAEFTGTADGMILGSNNSSNVFCCCKFTNSDTSTTTRPATTPGKFSWFISCEFTAPSATGVYAGSSAITVYWCWFHDCITAFSPLAQVDCRVIGCLFENCTFGASFTASSGTTIIGNTFFGCTDAIKETGAGVPAFIINNLIAYCTRGINWAGGAYKALVEDYNNFYANGTDVINVTKGANDTTTDPAFAALQSWTDLHVDSHTGTTSAVIHTTTGPNFQTYLRAGDRLWFGAATGWTSATYRILSVDSATAITVSGIPAADGTPDGVARTIRTGVGVADCTPGSASDVNDGYLGLSLGVG